MTSLADTASELIRTDPALAHEVARQMAARPTGGLTQRQSDTLQFIRRFHAERGVAPSMDEMCDALGLTAKSAVHRLVVSLEDRGYITRMPKRARSIVLCEVRP